MIKAYLYKNSIIYVNLGVLDKSILLNYYIFVNILFKNLKNFIMAGKFKITDRVTRSNKHTLRKRYNGLCGTVVEIIKEEGCGYRYKIKWDKKSGKYLPNYHGIFYPDKGQQHSTLQPKYLTKVV